MRLPRSPHPSIAGAAALAVLLLVAISGVAQEQSGPWSGTLRGDTTWSGEIVLVGDVVVPAHAVLRIEPGTRIRTEKPLPGRSADEGDLNPALVEVRVLGRLDAFGTEQRPILWGESPEREPAPPGRRATIRPRWLGIVLAGGPAQASRFTHCVFRGALAGIQSASGHPRIRYCTFLECGTGVGAGTAFGDAGGDHRIASRGTNPQIESCRFGDCDTGLYVDLYARASVERSIFLDCGIGIGRRYGGFSYPVRGLGPLVDRSLFHGNWIGIYGSGSVRDSIFTENERAFAASDFHRTFSSLVDRYHRSHNVYFGNDALVDDDIPLGPNALHLDPKFRGPPGGTAEQVFRTDLRVGFALSPTSPARGTATDGGDPGPFGSIGDIRGERGAGHPPAGVALESWLVAGPPGRVPGVDDGEFPRALRRQEEITAGGGIGEATWSSFAPHEGVLPRPPGSALLAATIESAGPSAGVLHLGLDGRVRAIRWNGKDLAAPGNRRRFRFRDMAWTVDVREGTNRLLLLVDARDLPAAISAHLTPLDPEALESLSAGAPTPPPLNPVVAAKVLAHLRTRSRPSRITIELAQPLRWLEAGRAEHWLLTDESGRPIRVSSEAVAYDPGENTVVITGLDLERAGVYLLTPKTLLDAWGRPIPDPGTPLRVRPR